MTSNIDAYFDALGRYARGATVTNRLREPVAYAHALDDIGIRARNAHQRGNKLMFVGNGGSAAIASHMAIDYSKNGGMRSIAFNDGPALTCLGNDLGYEQVFATQVALHGSSGDVLIAISSSGHSPNILNAVKAARNADCEIVTLSGFAVDNPLRSLGDLNIYVDSGEYGFVEISHLSILHYVLDVACGWRADKLPGAMRSPSVINGKTR